MQVVTSQQSTAPQKSPTIDTRATTSHMHHHDAHVMHNLEQNSLSTHLSVNNNHPTQQTQHHHAGHACMFCSAYQHVASPTHFNFDTVFERYISQWLNIQQSHFYQFISYRVAYQQPPSRAPPTLL
ncbi:MULTISPECIES: hypothetical protein [unclassified Acinetobacter]|uniref:hypothetical protein n=1 Tax=unclassified Acinetobacter TaxID=196816 RepID=UPI0035BA0EBE